jgi:hypothetical protein
MLKPATEMIDYAKAQVAKPHRETLEKTQKQLLWFVIALFAAFVCWGVVQGAKSRKRKPKAALW